MTSVILPQTLDANTFTVPLKHRMVVNDQSTLANYQVGSDDRTLVPYGTSTRITRWWIWMLVGAIGVLGVAGYRFRHRFFSTPG